MLSTLRLRSRPVQAKPVNTKPDESGAGLGSFANWSLENTLALLNSTRSGRTRVIVEAPFLSSAMDVKILGLPSLKDIQEFGTAVQVMALQAPELRFQRPLARAVIKARKSADDVRALSCLSLIVPEDGCFGLRSNTLPLESLNKTLKNVETAFYVPLPTCFKRVRIRREKRMTFPCRDELPDGFAIYTTLKGGNASEPVSAVLTDFSAGGILAKAQLDLDVGDRLDVTLRYTLDGHHLKGISGIVRHKRRLGGQKKSLPAEHLSYEYGIQFMFNNEHMRDAVRKIIFSVQQDLKRYENDLKYESEVENLAEAARSKLHSVGMC